MNKGPCSSETARTVLVPVCILILCSYVLGGEALQSWQTDPLEGANITAMPAPSKGTAVGLIDAKLKTSTLFSKLKGSRIQITFKEPRHISQLGMIRSGWSTWAIPKVILLKVNDSQAKRVELRGPRVLPQAKTSIPSDIDRIDIGVRVRSLEITIIQVESQTQYNTCGTLEIVEMQRGPVLIDLHEVGGVPADSKGLKLEFDLEEPVDQVNVKAFTDNRPLKEISAHYWSAVVNNLPSGRSTVTVPWEQFVNQTSPQWRLNPLNIIKFEIDRPRSAGKPLVLTWEFVSGQRRTKPAWEELSPISHEADSDGWRQGVPSQGFGRFGWTESKGLLVGNLAMNRFSYTIVNRKNMGRASEFKFYCGKSGEQQRWDRLYVDWTGVTHQALYGKEAKKAWANGKKKEVMPMSLIYSILVPGFLVDSDDQEFSFSITSEQEGEPSLLYVGSNGLKWGSSKTPLRGEDLSEGWLVAIWPAQPNMPVMFALKHRPTTIQAKKSTLVFNFPKTTGRIGIATPSGFRWWNGKVGELNADSRNLADKSRTLATIMRAYPKTCQMQFKDETKSVLVRETFGHIVWGNDWNEPAKAIAPVSPLLSFAADMKYPLQLPDGLKDLGIPTKVGPYRYVDGAAVEYRLSLPPTAGRMYLRPDGPDELADYVAAMITQKTGRSKTWLKTTNISPWIRWASRSLALTLMNESQRQDFIDSWRIVFEDAFRPHPWHIRTEPWSGAKYIYSFAWLGETNRTFGDINSGNGAILYAADLYARSSGDWALIERNWPLLNAVQRYYQVHHDWCYMQPPCHESTGDSAFDMELIGYLGAVGYMRMAEALGKKDDAALGRLYVARFAVPLCMRWLGAMWVAPDISSPGNLPFSSPGMTDSRGFVRWGQSPHWKIGLSLAWKGSTPEAFDCQLWGCGKPFWKYFEYELIENMKPAFRTEKSWFRPKNVCAHLYMRGLLGASGRELRRELEQQETPLGLKPKKRDAACHASCYAMAIGKDYPAVIRDWGRAELLKATYNSSENKATLVFRCDHPFTIVLDLKKTAKTHEINGNEGTQLLSGDGCRLNLPAGKTTLVLSF